MAKDRVVWAAAATAGGVTAATALARPVGDRLSDLHVYLGAAASPSLYDFTRGDAPFTYPPFAAMLFRALAHLPVASVQVAWTLATLAVIALIAALGKPGRAGPLALALALSAPIASNLQFGQVSVFLAGLVVVDLLALVVAQPYIPAADTRLRYHSRRTRWAGSLIGLAAAVKLTPLIFIPLLWCAGRRRAAITATVTFAGCAAVAALALPGDSWRFWTAEMFHVNRLGHIASAGNQSLNGMLLRFGVPESSRSLLVLTIGGAIAAIGLWRGARLARSGDWLGATIVLGAASVVLSPVSWTHHQIWLVLAVLLPVSGPAWVRAGWRMVVLAVMLLPVTGIDSPVWTNARLLLAVVVAAVVPVCRRDNPITPAAATAPESTASAVPVPPNRKPSPSTNAPAVAATTGLVTLTMASGAASPPPE